MPNSPTDISRIVRISLWAKWGVLLVALVAAIVLFFVFREKLSLQNLAEEEHQIRQFSQSHPLKAGGIAFAIYVTVTTLSLPFATVLSILYGWLFGFSRAVVLVSFASTAGATGAFLLSRFVFRDFVQRRFGNLLDQFNKALEKDGAFYLIFLRLMHYIPFFVINALMGLTNIRVHTFWWGTQLGMLPAAMIFIFLGSSITSLDNVAAGGIRSLLTPQLVIALVVLSVFPLIVAIAMRLLRKKNNDN